MRTDLSRQVEASTSLWETVDDDELVLIVGAGPYDEYRIVRMGVNSWALAMAGAPVRRVLTFAEVSDAKRAAAQHLTAKLWGELVP